MDSEGGEIRALGFGDLADRFEPMVQVGMIVQISKASLKRKRDNVRAVPPARCRLPILRGIPKLRALYA